MNVIVFHMKICDEFVDEVLSFVDLTPDENQRNHRFIYSRTWELTSERTERMTLKNEERMFTLELVWCNVLEYSDEHATNIAIDFEHILVIVYWRKCPFEEDF